MRARRRGRGARSRRVVFVPPRRPGGGPDCFIFFLGLRLIGRGRATLAPPCPRILARPCGRLRALRSRRRPSDVAPHRLAGLAKRRRRLPFLFRRRFRGRPIASSSFIRLWSLGQCDPPML